MAEKHPKAPFGFLLPEEKIIKEIWKSPYKKEGGCEVLNFSPEKFLKKKKFFFFFFFCAR
ncbi:hypothetical protein CH642_27645 [Salmonella enterica subsp. enterica serovar Heidelberg]|nr:hypothetical protein CH642_27645 [Salmonella enterica subsp. enterica serovar Heidelberg]